SGRAARGARSADPKCSCLYPSLAGQAFVVLAAVRDEQWALRPAARVVGFDAGEARALHGLRAAVVEALDAPLPCGPVQHQQVPFVDVAAQVKVQRLALADARRAVRGELDHPALVDLERGAENRLLMLVERVEMLHGALVLENGLPRLRRIEALRAQQPCERRVLDRERARKRLVRVDVRRDRLDACARAAADDADARR